MNRPTYEQALLQTVAYRGIRGAVNNVLEQYGINTTQWIILGVLSSNKKEVITNDIAKVLRVENPLATNLIKELVASKLVKYTPNKRDKRAKVLSLTSKGDSLVDSLEPELARALASIEACASPADWDTYFATLEKIIVATG